VKLLLQLLIHLPLLGLLAVPLIANAICLDAPRLTGVNLAGAEFNSKKLPGVMFKDYTYPNEAEMTYIAAQGANSIRLPLRWERLQREANGPLDAAELRQLKKTVDSANAKGLCVILDIHNYAKYYGVSMKDEASLEDAFVNLWVRIAAEFTDTEDTVFGLMNEPVNIPLPRWAVLAKRTLAELRKEGSRNRVFIGGGHWSGLHDWFKDHGGQSNAAAFADLKDPLNRVTLEVHQYADEYYSGTKTDCHPPEHFDPRFERIAAWADEHGQRLFLGEFGVPQTEPCLATLKRFMSLMNGSVWHGWSYWAAGSWWGSYPFALNTNAETPSPQWAILKPYFYKPGAPTSPPAPPGPGE
jgi:endoglucanase